jgi:putative ABC transport system permease protein
VQAVAVANEFPLEGDMQTRTPYAEGQPESPGDEWLAGVHFVSHNYFEAMGVPLLKGRGFTLADTEGARPVIIINKTMARGLFANEDPLGKRLRFSTAPEEQWNEIVGVVGDVKHEGLGTTPFMESYRPYLQSPSSLMAVAVRTTTDPSGLMAAARKAILEVDPNQPIYDIKTMSQRLSASVAPRRLSMLLFASFAAIALVLAAVGVYGVVSYSVNRQTREIGIRMALGARGVDVLRLVIGQVLLLTVGGVMVGLAAAFALARLMTSMLYGISATDPTTFAGVSLILITVALLAAYIPARRATRVDPVIALRFVGARGRFRPDGSNLPPLRNSVSGRDAW